MKRFIQDIGQLGPVHISRDESTIESTRSMPRYKWKFNSRPLAFIRRIFKQTIQAEAERFDNQNDDTSTRIPFY